jgi:hypothetical protein
MDTPVKLVDTTVTTISPAPSPSSVQPKQQPQSPSPSPQVQQQQQHVETPVPEVGENVFRTILKRLSQLEENVTLSQSYLEEQSRRLQEVFHDLEQSHRERMAVILEANKETLETSFTDLVRNVELHYVVHKNLLLQAIFRMISKIYTNIFLLKYIYIYICNTKP